MEKKYVRMKTGIKLLSRVVSVLSLGFITIGLVLPSTFIPSLATVATIDMITLIMLAILQ